MVTPRLERIVRYVRRWRPAGEAPERLTVSSDLPDADLRRLRRLIDESIDRRGGEVAARRKARLIGTTFSTLNTVGRRRFFEVLATQYDGDDSVVDRAIDTVLRATDPDQRRRAEAELREALVPRRERLLRRFVGIDGGLPFLVTLREDLLSHLSADPSLAAVDDDLKQILTGWFDVALLRLDRLTWDSPAALLERLIEYEAVHAIESWDDLKGRLGPGRRCYAFLHPGMPHDPLIFVEVALTKGMATSLPDLLDHQAERTDATEADTAIFYSISNCQQGLTGVSLGDFLIKSVAEKLSTDLPNVQNFATLSPLPGFRRWVTQAIANHEIALTPDEARRLSPNDPAGAEAAFSNLVKGPVPESDQALLTQAEPILMRLAADYLVNNRRGNRALDPVANFHLSNGASIDRLNWLANPSAAGWERGLGMMVNYHYELRSIERNHDRYLDGGEITASDRVRRLLEPIEADPSS